MSEPCFFCGVNAWTDCKHRKGISKPIRGRELNLTDEQVLANEKEEKRQKMLRYTGAGYNMKTAKSRQMSAKIIKEKFSGK